MTHHTHTHWTEEGTDVHVYVRYVISVFIWYGM